MKFFSKNNLLKFFGIILVLFASIQLIRPKVENPESSPKDDFLAVANPPETVKINIKNSCYDCHSNQTVYPWYNNVAPVSWLISRDIKEGRKELNFSEWAQYSEKRKAKKLDETIEQIEKNKMPLWFYKPLHPLSSLNEQQKDEIIKWLKEYSAKTEKT